MRYVYTIYDNKGEEIGRVCMVHNNDLAAIRDYQDAIEHNPNMKQHTEDYDLLCIGALNGAQMQIHVPIDTKGGTDIIVGARTVLSGQAYKNTLLANEAREAERRAIEEVTR